MDAQKTGRLIAEARKEQGITQKELSQTLHVSAQAVSKWVRGLNFPDLSHAVAALFPRDTGCAYGELLTNARQAQAAQRALDSVSRARRALLAGVTPDALLTDVEEALAALGELTGASVREDVTARIFARFCVGK